MNAVNRLQCALYWTHKKHLYAIVIFLCCVNSFLLYHQFNKLGRQQMEITFVTNTTRETLSKLALLVKQMKAASELHETTVVPQSTKNPLLFTLLHQNNALPKPINTKQTKSKPILISTSKPHITKTVTQKTTLTPRKTTSKPTKPSIIHSVSKKIIPIQTKTKPITTSTNRKTTTMMTTPFHTTTKIKPPIENNCDSKEISLTNWPLFTGSFLQGKIPKVVHFTSKTKDIPEQYKTFLSNCIRLNPNVTFLLWTDQAALDFISHKAKTDSKYKRLIHILESYSGIKKGDVIRLIIIHLLGGIYMDLDMECKQSFDFIFHDLNKIDNNKHNYHLSENSCLFDREEYAQARILYNRDFTVMNNFIVCKPEHPFITFVLQHLYRDNKKQKAIIQTGPLMLTDKFLDYQAELLRLFHSTKTNGETISLADPHWFSPLADNWESLKNLCLKKYGQNNWEGWQRKACETDLYEYILEHNSRSTSSYLHHRFLHLGYDEHKKEIKKLINVCDVKGIVVPSFNSI